MNQQIILCGRIQEAYDQFLQELLQLDGLHELILKIMILDLIIEEIYTKDGLNYLITQEEPLEIFYHVLDRYI